MLSTGDLWDLSGQDKKGQMLPSGTKTESTGTSESQVATTDNKTANSSFVNTQNTPQFSLDALHSLITQLSDHPALSDLELNKKAPLPRLADYAIRQYGVGGVDLGAGYDFAKYNADVAAAQAKRGQIAQDSGMVAGGTTALQQLSGQRNANIETLTKAREGYTKDAAFADASALSAKFARQLLEQVMPQLNRAAESSGTSGGAVRGLLANDAAARVAESQASLGLDTAVKYGQINDQLSNTLTSLIGQGDPTVNALLNALGISKGTIQTGTQGSTQTTSETKTLEGDKTATGDSLQLGIIPKVNQTASVAVGAGGLTEEQAAKLLGSYKPSSGYDRSSGFTL